MARVKRGVAARKRHKKIIKLAKGYRHSRKSVFRLAKQAILKAGQHSYRDRKRKKREFRALWIVRLNAACREQGITYGRFINGLKKAKIQLDRKALSQLALEHPDEFAKIIEKVKSNLSG